MPSILSKCYLNIFPAIHVFCRLLTRLFIFLVSLYSKQYGPDHQQSDQDLYCSLPPEKADAILRAKILVGQGSAILYDFFTKLFFFFIFFSFFFFNFLLLFYFIFCCSSCRIYTYIYIYILYIYIWRISHPLIVC